MKCPECGKSSRVVDSRSRYSEVTRRRECRKCGARWTTTETGNRDAFKRCTRCRQVWPRSDTFYSADKRNADGLHSWCKPCFSKYDSRRKTERRVALARIRRSEAA